jgi:hypothetical protein
MYLIANQTEVGSTPTATYETTGKNEYEKKKEG